MWVNIEMAQPCGFRDFFWMWSWMLYRLKSGCENGCGGLKNGCGGCEIAFSLNKSMICEFKN